MTENILLIELKKETIKVSVNKITINRTIQLRENEDEYQTYLTFDEGEIVVGEEREGKQTVNGFVEQLMEHPENEEKTKIIFCEEEFEMINQTLFALLMKQFLRNCGPKWKKIIVITEKKLNEKSEKKIEESLEMICEGDIFFFSER